MIERRKIFALLAALPFLAFLRPKEARAQFFLSPSLVPVTRTLTANGTAQLGDVLIEMNVAGANTYTVPTNASVAFPVGTWIALVQIGAGQSAFVAAGGVTIHSKSSWLKLSGQYSGASIYKRGTDEWVLIGDITA